MDAEKILEQAYGVGFLNRGHKAKGVVIHNDAGSQAATASYYQKWLNAKSAKELEDGFAHYYVSSDGTYQFASENSIAWHTLNQTGNTEYIGIEADQSMGDLTQFKKNEANALKLAAQVLKRLGLTANRTTVKLHKQFSSTSCPHRSVDIHGDGTAVQDYFIAQITKYMSGNASKNTNKPTKATKKSAIQTFKEANDRFILAGSFKVDKIEYIHGLWQIVNYELAGGKNFNWKLNGIPVNAVTNLTRGNSKPTQVGDIVKLYGQYNSGKIIAYDNATNGVQVKLGGYTVWLNADALLKHD